MIKKGRTWLGVSLAATALPLAFAASATAHPGVILRNSLGAPIGQNEAYSPKMTCMSTEAGMNGACHANHIGLEHYASSETHAVHKTQGVLDTDGAGNVDIYWQSYEVTAHDHGVVKGRHSQQGRNEDYSIAMKTAFDDAFFTSSPGMYGKF